MLMRFVAVLFFCSFVLKVVYCGPSEVEWQSFTLINQARGAAALPPLVWDQRLYNVIYFFYFLFFLIWRPYVRLLT